MDEFASRTSRIVCSFLVLSATVRNMKITLHYGESSTKNVEQMKCERVYLMRFPLANASHVNFSILSFISQSVLFIQEFSSCLHVMGQVAAG